jgi:small subunit ribosomal protein S7
MKWLIGATRGKGGKPMFLRLADELMAAFKGEGTASKRRDDIHKMAEANRAFSHLAF